MPHVDDPGAEGLRAGQAAKIASEVLAVHAADVDARGRFPSEGAMIFVMHVSGSGRSRRRRRSRGATSPSSVTRARAG